MTILTEFFGKKMLLDTNITRREALSLGICCLITSKSRPLWAQDNHYGSMITLFKTAIEVQKFARWIPLGEVNYYIIEYLKRDYDSRIKTLSAAKESGIFESTDSAIKYVRSIPDILPDPFSLTLDTATQDSQIVVINLLKEASLPIVPMAQSVLPSNIPIIEPPIDQQPCDSNIQILGDIIFETLGISFGDRSLITSFIDSDIKIKHNITELANKISTKKWEDVIELGEVLFKLIVGSKIWGDMSTSRRRKLTFRLALRCVPVVGWIYMGTSFLVTVKANYHRFCFEE